MRAFLLIFVSIFAVTAFCQVGKITPELERRIAKARPGEQLDVVVYLVNQPGPPIARQVRPFYEPQIEDLAAQVRAIVRLGLPTGNMRPEEEVRYPLPASPQLELLRSALNEQIDSLRNRMVDEIANRASMVASFDHAAVSQHIAALGGRVRGATAIMSTVSATLPAKSIARLAANYRICWIDVDHAGAPELDIQKVALGLTTGFWPANITGGHFDAGVLDTGVQQNHPAFAPHRFESQNGLTTDPDGHGTGIAGILASTDATYRGMAFGCDTICVAVAGGDSTSMTGMHFLVTATTEKPENVNYSFGNGIASDNDYSPFDRFFDGMIDTLGIMTSKSTGNNGWGTTTITHPAPAFNLMASANMDDRNTVTRADDIITSSSSRGPTLGGRKKPDISAPGTGSRTTTRTLGFGDLGGTSAASPHTGGGIILLTDMGNTSVIACKAILLNTAQAWTDNGTQATGDDGPVAGSQWNKTFGWGYLDLGRAYLHGLDVFLKDMPAPPTGGRNYKLFKGMMFAGEKATLVWNRHVAYNGATYPTQVEALSNLDLNVWRASDSSLLKTSASTIDNVEQIDVSNDGEVVLKVYTTGQFDPEVPQERFALATEENFTEAVGPSLSVSFIHPPQVQPNQQFTLTARVTNNGDLPANSVTVNLSGITIVSGDNPQSLPAINPGSSGDAVWVVRAQGSPGQQQVTANAQSVSYGETFTGAGNSSITVGGGIINVDSMQLQRGIIVSGGIGQLHTSDDMYLVIRPGIVFSTSESPIQAVFDGTASASPSSLAFSVESGANQTGIEEVVELYNFSTNSWTELSRRTLSTGDTVALASVAGNPSGYVEAGTMRVRARIGCKAVAPIFSYPWLYRIDQAVWLVN